MNALADDIVTSLRRALSRLPGATTISLHEMKDWTYILVLAPTDTSVDSVSAELGIGPPKARTGKADNGGRRWWRCATSGRANLQIDVIGPAHAGDPPADGDPADGDSPAARADNAESANRRGAP